MERQLLMHHAKSGVKINGNYIEFDKNSNLDFAILPNFTLRELLTKNTADTFTKISFDVLLTLQLIRNKFGNGIGVSSSYRSPTYNRSIKGATASEHIKGNALDIYPINGDIKGLHKIGQSVSFNGGLGFYNSFMHIDSGAKRFWDERK